MGLSYEPEKHECYQNSWKAVEARDFDWPDNPCLIVHGFPRLQAAYRNFPAGSIFGHSWLERKFDERDYKHPNLEWLGPYCFSGTVAICPTKLVIMDRRVYYALGSIKEQECQRYTRKEYFDLMVDLCHYGPYVDKPGAVYRD